MRRDENEKLWNKRTKGKKDFYSLETEVEVDTMNHRDFHIPYCSTFPVRIYWKDLPTPALLFRPPATIIHRSIELEISSCDNDCNLKIKELEKDQIYVDTWRVCCCCCFKCVTQVLALNFPPKLQDWITLANISISSFLKS
jgi:hypothetical protein